MDGARDAFEKAIHQHYAHGGLPIRPTEVRDPAVQVAGFVALEGWAQQIPVRGWANDAGLVVLAPFINYGPIVAALGVLQGRGATASDLAARVAWASGPSYRVLESPPAELGRSVASVKAPATRRDANGSVEIDFYLRDLDPEDPSICRYEFRVSSADDCRVRIDGVWPKLRD